MEFFEQPYHDIFDSHSHYDSERFDEDREEIFENLPKFGVCAAVDIGCDLESSRAAVAISQRIPYFYASVGYHPSEASTMTEEGLQEIEQLLSLPKTVAIGEIGLDYHYGINEKDLQKEVFRRQLQLASRLHRRVIIHSREASQDTVDILKEFPDVTGVVHCFSGSAETARVLLKMGYYIGFTGAITFKNARRNVEACAAVPLDRILLETDCPYMAPEPYRGKRCWSPLIAKTAEKAAELHNVTPQELIDHARENTCRLFGIELPKIQK